MEFRYSVPRELVQVWYRLGCFLKLYNLSYSDLVPFPEVENPKNPGIQPYYFQKKTILLENFEI